MFQPLPEHQKLYIYKGLKFKQKRQIFLENASVVWYTIRCDMRKWLRGRASPCQGEGREFESRLPLQHIGLQPPRMQPVYIGVWRSLVACLTGGQEASGSSPDTPTRIKRRVRPVFFILFVIDGTWTREGANVAKESGELLRSERSSATERGARETSAGAGAPA